MQQFDVIIIGGGVVGCMTARALSRFQIQVLLIEKEADIGTGASSANSAIIHAGHDPLPGSLKAEMNRLANPMWDHLSEELGIPFKRSGAYVVAIGDEEFACLESLRQRGLENGVECEIITGEEMRKREPLINPDVRGALFTPTAGMVDPFAACIAPLENAMENGVTVALNTEFIHFITEGDRMIGVHTSQGDFKCNWVVNAAGVYSDDIIRLSDPNSSFDIHPRKGEYYILDQSDIQLDTILFPVPTGNSKGILVLGSTHGNVLVGPNSNSEKDKEDRSVTSAGLDEIWRGAQKLIPGLTPRSIIAVFAGLRASGNAPCRACGIDYNHDFMIEASQTLKGLVHAAGIESPGLTAAPAIADRIIEVLAEEGCQFVPKTNWNPIRKARPRFHKLSQREQHALIEQDPRYGRVICRCEMITEGEIVAEMNAPLPARTYDAIKRRTWLGTGRCLGSFDLPRVIDLLARETGQSITKISKKGEGSEFLFRATKDVEA